MTGATDEHPLLTTVGVAAVALGVLMVVQPWLAASIGVGYAAAILVGLLALVQAIRVARTRQASEIRGAETPDVETVETVPTPGDEFDRTVAELGSGPRRVAIRDRADLRESIEAAAVTAVADRENCSPEAARERLDDGTWTDDVHAASFLGGAEAPSPSLFDRVKLAASAESSFQFGIRRTADAVARTAGVTPADPADGDESAGVESDGKTHEDTATGGPASERRNRDEGRAGRPDGEADPSDGASTDSGEEVEA